MRPLSFDRQAGQARHGGLGKTSAGGTMPETAFLITTFATLFVVIDPPGLVPLFRLYG